MSTNNGRYHVATANHTGNPSVVGLKTDESKGERRSKPSGAKGRRLTDKSEDLRHRLDEANENSIAIVKVVEAVSKASTVNDAAVAALETVKAAFGWAYGSYWRLDAKSVSAN